MPPCACLCARLRPARMVRRCVDVCFYAHACESAWEICVATRVQRVCTRPCVACKREAVRAGACVPQTYLATDCARQIRLRDSLFLRDPLGAGCASADASPIPVACAPRQMLICVDLSPSWRVARAGNCWRAHKCPPVPDFSPTFLIPLHSCPRFSHTRTGASISLGLVVAVCPTDTLRDRDRGRGRGVTHAQTSRAGGCSVMAPRAPDATAGWGT